MAGIYTDIVEIVAPSSAVAGETVPVTIKIKNIWTDYLHVSAVGVLDTEDRFIDWPDYWIPAGATHSFPGAFVMPTEDVIIHAYSYYETLEGYQHLDDEAAKNVWLAVPTTFHLDIHVPSWAYGGYVDPGSGDYPVNTTVKLRAYPFDGYEFVSWGVDASGTSPTYNLYMDSDKYVEAYFEKVPVPEVYAGTIIGIELEHNGAQEGLPVYNIPQGQTARVHVWGRNDMTTTQRLGIHWLVYDPDGEVVEDYEDWSLLYYRQGTDHQFISERRFNLDKQGTYTLNIALSMNPADPEIVDSYYGTLCTVAAVVPEPEFREFELAEYNKR